jgi:2-phosphosulfolactate phosphatase
MEFKRLTLRDCGQATGTVVVIDVLRAFTTAAYALAAGAREIVLTDRVDEAFALRDRFRSAGEDVLLMGELRGEPIQGFDLSNSPAAVAALAVPAPVASSLDLTGRRLVQRTSAGTAGVVCASAHAEVLLASSLVVGRATARYLRQLAPEQVTFVITGAHNRGPSDGEEDAAGADYIQALLARSETGPREQPKIDSTPYVQRVRESFVGRLFGTPEYPHLAAADLELAVDVDRFDFCLRVEREDDLLVMRPVRA